MSLFLTAQLRVTQATVVNNREPGGVLPCVPVKGVTKGDRAEPASGAGAPERLSSQCSAEVAPAERQGSEGKGGPQQGLRSHGPSSFLPCPGHL